MNQLCDSLKREDNLVARARSHTASVDKSRTIDVSGTTGIGVTSPSGRVSVKDPNPPKLQALVNGIHPVIT